MDIISMATSLQPNTSPEFTLTVIIAGLGIVLATLAFLIVIFNIFGKIVSSSQSKAKEKKNKKLLEQMEADGAFEGITEQPDFSLPEPSVESQEGISPEIVAAISAAIYSLEGGHAKITSIKRKSKPASARSAWAQAAVIDNTRPF